MFSYSFFSNASPNSSIWLLISSCRVEWASGGRQATEASESEREASETNKTYKEQSENEAKTIENRWSGRVEGSRWQKQAKARAKRAKPSETYKEQSENKTKPTEKYYKKSQKSQQLKFKSHQRTKIIDLVGAFVLEANSSQKRRSKTRKYERKSAITCSFPTRFRTTRFSDKSVKTRLCAQNIIFRF